MPLPIARHTTLASRLLPVLGLLFAACQSRGGTIEASEAGRIRTLPATLPAAESTPVVGMEEQPATGDTIEFTVLMSGRAAGRLRQWPDTGGTVTTNYAYNDRGRGPSLTQTLRLDKAGLPVGMVSIGR